MRDAAASAIASAQRGLDASTLVDGGAGKLALGAASDAESSDGDASSVGGGPSTMCETRSKYVAAGFG